MTAPVLAKLIAAIVTIVAFVLGIDVSQQLGAYRDEKPHSALVNVDQQGSAVQKSRYIS